MVEYGIPGTTYKRNVSEMSLELLMKVLLGYDSNQASNTEFSQSVKNSFRNGSFRLGVHGAGLTGQGGSERATNELKLDTWVTRNELSDLCSFVAAHAHEYGYTEFGSSSSESGMSLEKLVEMVEKSFEKKEMTLILDETKKSFSGIPEDMKAHVIGAINSQLDRKSENDVKLKEDFTFTDSKNNKYEIKQEDDTKLSSDGKIKLDASASTITIPKTFTFYKLSKMGAEKVLDIRRTNTSTVNAFIPVIVGPMLTVQEREAETKTIVVDFERFEAQGAKEDAAATFESLIAENADKLTPTFALTTQNRCLGNGATEFVVSGTAEIRSDKTCNIKLWYYIKDDDSKYIFAKSFSKPIPLKETERILGLGGGMPGIWSEGLDGELKEAGYSHSEHRDKKRSNIPPFSLLGVGNVKKYFSLFETKGEDHIRTRKYVGKWYRLWKWHAEYRYTDEEKTFQNIALSVKPRVPVLIETAPKKWTFTRLGHDFVFQLEDSKFVPQKNP